MSINSVHLREGVCIDCILVHYDLSQRLSVLETMHEDVHRETALSNFSPQTLKKTSVSGSTVRVRVRVRAMRHMR